MGKTKRSSPTDTSPFLPSLERRCIAHALRPRTRVSPPPPPPPLPRLIPHLCLLFHLQQHASSFNIYLYIYVCIFPRGSGNPLPPPQHMRLVISLGRGEKRLPAVGKCRSKFSPRTFVMSTATSATPSSRYSSLTILLRPPVLPPSRTRSIYLLLYQSSSTNQSVHLLIY